MLRWETDLEVTRIIIDLSMVVWLFYYFFYFVFESKLCIQLQ